MNLENIEAEAELLGQLLSNRAAPDDLADKLKASDFAVPAHARIYEVAMREAMLDRPFSPVALKPHFDGDDGLTALGGLPYLARLTGIPSMLRASDYVRLLTDLSKRRRMQDGLRTAADACSDLETTTAEIMEHADGALSDPARELIHQPSGADAIGDLIRSYGDNIPGVTCGCIPQLDELLGPMKPKQFIIGAGRPGMGKTALALSYSLGAAQRGHGVLFVSLEMSATELGARMASDLCFPHMVPFEAIRDGKLNDTDLRRVKDAEATMRKLPFQIVDAGSLTPGRLGMLIRRHTRRLEARGFSLDLVVVDYLQLLRPDERARSAYEAVSEVSRALKALAKDCSVPIFALAQLSREVEKRADRRPVLSDLRDSGQIEQDADAVLFLVRQEYYHRQVEPERGSREWSMWKEQLDRMSGEIEFILAKRRNGRVGNATGAFHGAYQAVRG